MTIKVFFTDDPVWILENAKSFLASEPVRHNLILTLLQERAIYPESGRYWMVTNSTNVIGIVFQSPFNSAAICTSLSHEAINVVINEIMSMDIALPGISGEAETVKDFSEQWIEHNTLTVRPLQGRCLYEVFSVQEKPTNMNKGYLRQALIHDRNTIIALMQEFQSEVGEQGDNLDVFVDRRLAAGRFWLWDDNGPTSMVVTSEPAEGVIRLRVGYTSSEKRNCGYARLCISKLSQQIQDGGYRCIAYADLDNPIINHLLYQIGYRAVAEILLHKFE